MSSRTCTCSFWHPQVHYFYEHYLYSALHYDTSFAAWMSTKTPRLFSRMSIATSTCFLRYQSRQHCVHTQYTINYTTYTIFYIQFTICQTLYNIHCRPYTILQTQYIIYHTKDTIFDHCVTWLEKPFTMNIFKWEHKI